MTNKLVVQRTLLPASQKKIRAAQYVRISTDKQQYSIENQAGVIAGYAQLYDLQIIRTCSLLQLKDRLGLTQFLADVSSANESFAAVSSRVQSDRSTEWARFRIDATNRVFGLARPLRCLRPLERSECVAWPDDVAISIIQPQFVCEVRGTRGADIRSDFEWQEGERLT